MASNCCPLALVVHNNKFEVNNVNEAKSDHVFTFELDGHR